jgi:hypothetical protein
MLRTKEEMKVRALKLAKLYGPFVRFSPDGNEGTEDPNKEILDGAIKTAEEADLEGNEVFDKTRQRADQATANATKATERATTAETALEASQQESASLKEQLATAKEKAAEAGIENVELNPDDHEDSEKPIVRAVLNLQKQIKAKSDEIAGLKEKAANFEQNKATEAAKLARDVTYSELLGDLDDEYGADCRNDAVAEFQKLAKDGKVPKDAVKATRIMEKCYKDVKAKTKTTPKKEKTSINLDSGSGGGNTLDLQGSEIPNGPLDDVAKATGKALVASGYKSKPD